MPEITEPLPSETDVIKLTADELLGVLSCDGTFKKENQEDSAESSSDYYIVFRKGRNHGEVIPATSREDAIKKAQTDNSEKGEVLQCRATTEGEKASIQKGNWLRSETVNELTKQFDYTLQ